MKLYLKNVFRAIFKNRGSYFGAISIIALGILVYVSMSDIMTNLQKSTDTYYEKYNFADVFATVSGLPEQKIKAIENIQGIEQADGRLGVEVRLLLEGKDTIINLHLMGYDSTKDGINRFMISSNSNEINEDSILLGNKMLKAYGLSSGDKIDLIISGKLENFIIAGTVQAPEYIYAVPPSGAVLPDDEIYGIACINKDKLQKLLNKNNLSNELGFKLTEGYEFSDVKNQLETMLKPYGLMTLEKREDQISNYMIHSEFAQLKALSTMLPAIFLTVSIFMLYIILKRMIDQDRALIGTIKAFGFRDSEIIATYMKQSLLTGILGAIMGSALAYPLGLYMFGSYVQFYNLPSTDYKSYFSNILVGTLLAIVTSIIATYFGIKDILNINPAEAMRSEAPVFNTKLKFSGIFNKLFNSRKKMAIRAILRNKIRSIIIAFAIAFPFALVAVLSSFSGVAEQMFFDQFTKIQTYDLKVGFNNYVGYNAAIASVKEIDGVYNVEPIAEYPIHIKHQNLSEYTKLVALNRDSDSYKIMDNNDKYYEPRADGLIINSGTAKKLGVVAGDIVEISNNNLSKEAIKIPIIQVVDESFGAGVYIDINSVSKYFNINKLANSIVFNVEKGKITEVKKILINTRNIASVTDKERTLNNYRRTMESMMTMIGVFGFLSVLSGVILIYNISNITMRERKGEFGTMTILGMRFNEIIEMISFEQFINFCLGIIIGYPLSFVLRDFVEGMVAADTYNINLEVMPQFYLYSFFVCLIIMLLSLVAILRNIKNIDMTEVLKERE